MTQPVVSRDPKIMGGTPVFAGTRVSVQTLLDRRNHRRFVDRVQLAIFAADRYAALNNLPNGDAPHLGHKYTEYVD